MTKNEILRKLCRKYLKKLRYIAMKHGIASWVDETIEATKNPNCKPSEYEVNLLARCVNDERIKREEIPPLLGKNYRKCNEADDFSRIKKLPTVGIYSKISAVLYANGVKLPKKKKYQYVK